MPGTVGPTCATKCTLNSYFSPFTRSSDYRRKLWVLCSAFVAFTDVKSTLPQLLGTDRAYLEIVQGRVELRESFIVSPRSPSEQRATQLQDKLDVWGRPCQNFTLSNACDERFISTHTLTHTRNLFLERRNFFYWKLGHFLPLPSPNSLHKFLVNFMSATIQHYRPEISHKKYRGYGLSQWEPARNIEIIDIESAGILVWSTSWASNADAEYTQRGVLKAQDTAIDYWTVQILPWKIDV